MANVLFKGAVAAAAVVAGLGMASTDAEAGGHGKFDFKCKTAKLIVPWGAGGGTAVVFNIFEKAVNDAGASPRLQVVTIPGQGGNKGAKEARKAKPDGCTLFAIHQSALTSYFNGRVDFTWDAFEPIALLTSTPAIVGATGAVPYSNLTEMIDFAKKNPGAIRAGGTLGSTSHFFLALLEDEAGIKFRHVSYDGTRQRITALLANNIDIGEINLSTAKKNIEQGKLKALAYLDANRSTHIPDVATAKEQGVSLTAATSRGVMAPKGTPKDALVHWGKLFKKATENPDVQKQMDAKGILVTYMGPDDYSAWFKDTYAKWEKVAIKIGMYKKK